MTTIAYDSDYHIFPLTTTNALSHTVTNEYYGVNGVALSSGGYAGLWGQLKSTTDPNNQQGSRVYDVFGRLVKTISPLDSLSYPTSETEYAYFSTYMQVTSKQRKEHGVVGTIDGVTFTDGLGRTIQSKTISAISGQYIVSGQVEYNSRGLAVKQYFNQFTLSGLTTIDAINTNIPHTTIGYDDMGRVVQSTNPDGTYSSVDYDDWTTRTINENGQKQESDFDAYGRLTAKREYTGVDGRSPHYAQSPYVLYATTQYEYDSEGNLTKTIDAHNTQTVITYDKLGRKVSMNDPDMGVWNYTYDKNGNLKTQTDAKGQTITFTYDTLNRLKNKTDGASLDVDYEYDNDFTPDPNVKGRLTHAIYDNGQTEFKYDELGRELESIKQINNTSYGVKRNYDGLNNLLDVEYPDAEKVYYNYNSVGQIKEISNDPALFDQQTKLDVKPEPSMLHNALAWVERHVLGVREVYASDPESHWLEAEHADSIDPIFTVANDSAASEGQYIYVPNGHGVSTSTPSNNFASYEVTITEADSYKLWGRVITPNDSDDSFWVQVDDGTDQKWHIVVGSSWHWDYVDHNNFGSGTPSLFNLSAGTHTIKIKWREDGTKIDKLVLTNDMSLVPSGVGEVAENINTPIEECGNGTVEGSEVCEVGDNQSCTTANNYAGTQICNAQCTDYDLCVATESCGDGVRNGNEECDGESDCDANCQIIPSTSTDPIAHWKFDETSGLQASDDSGNNHTGTLIGMNGDEWIDGYLNGGLAFNGSVKVDVGQALIPASDDFSITAWINLTDLATYRVIMGQYAVGQSGRFLFEVNTSGQLLIFNGTNVAASPSGSVPVGEWVHVAVAREGDIYTTYINGVQSGTSTSSTALYQGVNTTIGGAHIYYMKGSEDDVRIYHHALSSADILILAQEEGSTPVPICGDNIVDAGEECDGSAAEHYTCESDCTLTYIPYCGDTIVDAGEECDDGNTTLGDGCDASCQNEIIDPPSSSGEQLDYTTFTTHDTTGKLTVASDCLSIDHLQTNNSDTYVQKAIGIPNEFEHSVEVEISYITGWARGPVILGVSDTENQTINNWQNGIALEIRRDYQSNPYFILRHRVSGVESPVSNSSRSEFFDYSTRYYVTITKQGNTVTADIYSDAAKTQLFDSISGTTSVSGPYAYLYGLSMRDWNESGASASGSICNLTIDETVVPPIAETPTLYVTNVEYNVHGQITQVEYGNGVVTDYTYDPLTLRLTRLATSNQQQATIQDLSYTYDSVGNILTITDAVNTANQTFEYDDLNRLVESDGETYGQKSYTYDEIGNIIVKDGKTYSYDGIAGGPHAVTSLSDGTTMTYDDNGNMVTKQDGATSSLTEYAYDVENRLIEVKKDSASIETYEYDGDGGRTKKVNSDGTTIFVGSLYETHASSTTRHVYLGSTRVATIRDGHIKYAHNDHLGGTNVVTDSTGSVEEVVEYTPFGGFARKDFYGQGSEAANYYFTQHFHDEKTGLTYMQARYYDSALGRFISADPSVQNLTNPVTMNRYQYAGNNPVNFTDPSGYGFWKSFIAAVVGVVAAVLTAGISIGFQALAQGGLAALTAGQAALAGAVGGAVSGGLGAGLNGAGFGGILKGAAFGAALGGVGGFAAGGGFGAASGWVVGGLVAGGVANAAVNDSWADFAGGLVGSVVGTFAGMGAVKAFAGTSSTSSSGASAAQVIQETVDNNPGDLQGAIDSGRSAGGEAGASQAAQAVANAKVDVRGAVQKTMVAGSLDAAGGIKVKVPFSHRGSIGSSVGRAGVLRGGAKSIVSRATNSLGVAAKVAGKTLNAYEAFNYANSSAKAFQSGNIAWGIHDAAKSFVYGTSIVAARIPHPLGQAVGRLGPYVVEGIDAALY